jgi:uncharacterized OsmC-like protein
LGFDLNGIKIDVEKIMKSDPRRVSGINLFFYIPDDLKDIGDKIKQILKQTGRTCPVWLSIHPDIEVDVDWQAWS